MELPQPTNLKIQDALVWLQSQSDGRKLILYKGSREKINDQPKVGYKDEGNVGGSARTDIFLDFLCSQCSACLAKLSTDQDCRNCLAHTPWVKTKKPKNLKQTKPQNKQTSPQRTNNQKYSHQNSEQQGHIFKTLWKPLSSPTNAFINRWD